MQTWSPQASNKFSSQGEGSESTVQYGPVPEEDTAVSVRVHHSHGEKEERKEMERDRAGSNKQRRLQAFRNVGQHVVLGV